MGYSGEVGVTDIMEFNAMNSVNEIIPQREVKEKTNLKYQLGESLS